MFADRIINELNRKGEATFQFGDNEVYALRREGGAPPAVMGKPGEVIIPAALPAAELVKYAGSHIGIGAALSAAGIPPILELPVEDTPVNRPVTFRRHIEGQSPPDINGREGHLLVRTGTEPGTLRCTLELYDVVSRSGGETVERKSYPQSFTVPMPPDVAAIQTQGLKYYQRMSSGSIERQAVGRALLVLSNQVLAESHSRVSFAISCLVLVMVGCSLGLMFRSGNFLSAFAVSFIPALFTITLIVAGQRVSGSIPDQLKAGYTNTPLSMGMALIWTGNCVNFVLAVVLLGRLQKQ